MSVGRICMREVDYIEADESARTAASRMLSRNVGSLVVLDPKKRPVGLVTDRDLAVRVVAEARDPSQTPVSEIMSPAPKTVVEQTPIEDALSLMRAGPFRRLPVVDSEGVLVGILSLDDILDLLCEEFGFIHGLLSRESPDILAQK